MSSRALALRQREIPPSLERDLKGRRDLTEDVACRNLDSDHSFISLGASSDMSNIKAGLHGVSPGAEVTLDSAVRARTMW